MKSKPASIERIQNISNFPHLLCRRHPFFSHIALLPVVNRRDRRLKLKLSIQRLHNEGDYSTTSFLSRLLLPANAHIQVAHDPAQRKDDQHPRRNRKRLSESRAERQVIRDEQVPVPELVDDIEGSQGNSSPAHSIHEGAV